MSMNRDRQTDELFRSILSLQSVEECYRYFEDLCTMKEIRDLGQRLEVARLLDEGRRARPRARAPRRSAA